MYYPSERMNTYLAIMGEVHSVAKEIKVPSQECAYLLQRINRWDLDMFKLYNLADESPVTAIGMKIVGDFGLWDALPLDRVSGSGTVWGRRAP